MSQDMSGEEDIEKTCSAFPGRNLKLNMYLYELPTTGAISFSDFCIDQSTTKAYSFYISQSTQARANVRGVLKESKRTGHEQKDFLQLVKVRLWHTKDLVCH